MGAADEMPVSLLHDHYMLHRALPRQSLTIALLVAAGTSHATASPRIMLGGPYGTDEGCSYARTLDWNDHPDYFQIEEFALQTPEATCNFGRFDKNTPDEVSGPVICLKAPQNDIPQQQYVTTAQIVRKDDAYWVKFGDGTGWGPIRKC